AARGRGDRGADQGAAGPPERDPGGARRGEPRAGRLRIRAVRSPAASRRWSGGAPAGRPRQVPRLAARLGLRAGRRVPGGRCRGRGGRGRPRARWRLPDPQQLPRPVRARAAWRLALPRGDGVTPMERDVAAFLADLADQGRSPNTVAAYRNDLGQFLAARPRAATAGPRRADVASWVADLAEHYAAASIARKIAAVRAWCRWLVGCGALDADPTTGIEGSLPRLGRRATTAPPGEAVAVLLDGAARRGRAAPADLRDDAIVRLLAATGVRASELCALDVADLEGGVVREGEQDARALLVNVRGRRGGRRRAVREPAWPAPGAPGVVGDPGAPGRGGGAHGPPATACAPAGGGGARREQGHRRGAAPPRPRAARDDARLRACLGGRAPTARPTRSTGGTPGSTGLAVATGAPRPVAARRRGLGAALRAVAPPAGRQLGPAAGAG